MEYTYRSIAPQYKDFSPDLNADCPYCKKPVGITLISGPNVALVQKHELGTLGAVYKCEGCKKPIHFEYYGCRISFGKLQIIDSKQIENVRPNLDLQYVENLKVKANINEALDCFSVSAWNGFASMSRRSLQAICDDQGANAKSKIQKQVTDFIAILGFDKEMDELVGEIVKTGHDGSHPILPQVDKERAKVLLVFLGEIINQVYTLPSQIKHSKKLRGNAIEQSKNN